MKGVMQLKKERPIGIFDSGVGGLATLQYLQAAFPHEHFVYVADEAHFPYGNRTKEELLALIKGIIDFFVQKEVKLIIVACNTASSVLPDVPDVGIPIFGVIDPTVRAVKALPGMKKILLLATEYTINSGTYQKKLKDYDVNGLICNDFARLAESGEFAHPLIRKQLEGMPEYDGVILGCTHYSFLRDAIQEVFPDALLVESSKAVVADIGRYLLEHAFGNDPESSCRTSLYTSGDPELFAIKVRMLNICHDFLGSISLK
jgi:glutamate racemase